MLNTRAILSRFRVFSSISINRRILASVWQSSRQFSSRKESTPLFSDLRLKFENDIKNQQPGPCAASWGDFSGLNPAVIYSMIQDIMPITGKFSQLRELSLRAYEKEGPVALALVFSSPLSQWFSVVSPGYRRHAQLVIDFFNNVIDQMPLVAIPGMLYVSHTFSVLRPVSSHVSTLAKKADAIFNSQFDYYFIDFRSRRHDEYQYTPTPLELEYFYIDPHNHGISQQDRQVTVDEFGEAASMYLKPAPMFRSITDIMCAYTRSVSLALCPLRTSTEMRFLERIIVAFGMFSLMSTRFRYSVMYAIGAVEKYDSGSREPLNKEDLRRNLLKEVQELAEDDPLRPIVEDLLLERYDHPLSWEQATAKLLRIQRACMFEQGLAEKELSNIISVRFQRRKDMLQMMPDAGLYMEDIRDSSGFVIKESRQAAYQESYDKGLPFPMIFHGFRPNDVKGLPSFQELRLFLKFITIGGCRDLTECMGIETTKFAPLSNPTIVKASAKAFPVVSYLVISIVRSLVVMLPTWLSSVDRLSCLVDIIDASCNFLAWGRQRLFLDEIFHMITITLPTRIRSTVPPGALSMILFRLLLAMETSRETNLDLANMTVECIATCPTPIPLDVMLRTMRAAIICGTSSEHYSLLMKKIIRRASTSTLDRTITKMLMNFSIGVIKSRNFPPIVELAHEMIEYYKSEVIAPRMEACGGTNADGLFLTINEFITVQFLLGVIPTYITGSANQFVNEIETTLLNANFRFYDEQARRCVPFEELTIKDVSRKNEGGEMLTKFFIVSRAAHLLFCGSQTRRTSTPLTSKLLIDFVCPSLDKNMKMERFGTSIIRSLAFCWVPKTQAEADAFHMLAKIARDSCLENTVVANHRCISYLWSMCLCDELKAADVDLLEDLIERLNPRSDYKSKSVDRKRQIADGDDAEGDDDTSFGEDEFSAGEDGESDKKPHRSKGFRDNAARFYDAHINVDLLPEHIRPLGQVLCFAQHLHPTHHLFNNRGPSSSANQVRTIIDQCIDSYKRTVYSTGSTTQRDLLRRLKLLGVETTSEVVIGVLYADAVIRDKKIAIEFHGPIHYSVNNPNEFSAATGMKARLFELHGYEVLHVSFRDFEIGMSQERKWTFLMDFVTRNGLKTEPFLPLSEYLRMDEQSKARKLVENKSII